MIVRLTPCFKDYLWGGKTLGERYYPEQKGKVTAESWVASAYPGSESLAVLQDGNKLSFDTYLHQCGVLAPGESYPLLMKLIDAEKPLSVQVHPNNDYARSVGAERGKTEFWYILSARPDAYLYCGPNRKVSREELGEAAQNGTLETLLQRVPVHEGDMVFVESGMIHAIGAGIVLCEVQQSCDLTYRLYDYNRRGADGKPRELHLKDALAAASLSPARKAYTSAQTIAGRTVNWGEGKRTLLSRTACFSADLYEVCGGEMPLKCETATGACILVLSGEAKLSDAECTLSCKEGDAFYTPALRPRLTLSGEAKVLCAWY